MNSIRWLKSPPGGDRFAQRLFLVILMSGLFLALVFPQSLYFAVMLAGLCLRFPQAVVTLVRSPWFPRSSTNLRTIGVMAGTLLFGHITVHADPVLAQIFDQAEQEVDGIFGEYLDSDIITFLFGLIRVVIWVSAVGFVFFAIYQAQRGEQWQPLAQNAFIIVAAVVLVEGLSTLFFGGGTGGGTAGGGGGGGGG